MTIAAEPDEDEARVEKLRRHTADHPFKRNRRASEIQTSYRCSVLAEMTIRSAFAATSRTLRFTNRTKMILITISFLLALVDMLQEFIVF